MASENQDVEYRANDADALVKELFSGGVSIAEATERLRTRLLDLSARNRLLNYCHPKGRCIQICDDPGLNLVFDRLFLEGHSVPLRSVPDPNPSSYDRKKPDPKSHAERLGISTSFEFAVNGSGSQRRRLHNLQTLFYPAELERQARRTAGEAKTAIEETGTNMLFLIFGFLEYYESEESDRPRLAPLISVPAALTRGAIDQVTRTYEYTVSHNGEDLAENQTLREKLRRDFMLSLPEFSEEDEPESYFARVEEAVATKRRWRVCRQLTLGMLSFGKLAIWADLDTRKNARLLQHPLLRSIFSGCKSESAGGFYAEDYEIDNRPEAVQPLVFDADSSQHSAIIDVLAGKNLVINGPPGTGKSQTITNVIAAALAQGKRVLFVSEKLAALEVVRHRLNQAGLGHFCLELHSHKTQKKKLIEDVAARIEARFPAPPEFQAKLATLKRQKVDLARYAELMGSRVGNALGITVNEIFWAAERYRQELGELSPRISTITLSDAVRWPQDEIEVRTAKLSALAGLYAVVGCANAQHPWWGFLPSLLAPSDDELIGSIVLGAIEAARQAALAAEKARAIFGLEDEPGTKAVASIRATLEQIPALPSAVDIRLLARMFDQGSDPRGRNSGRVLAEVMAGVTRARELFNVASMVLLDGVRTSPSEMARIQEVTRQLSPDFLQLEVSAAEARLLLLRHTVENFRKAAELSRAPYSQLERSSSDGFLAQAAKLAGFALGSVSISTVARRADAVREACAFLSAALSRVEAVALRIQVPFDGTNAAVKRLAGPEPVPGLRPGVAVDEAALAAAHQFASSPLSDAPIAALRQLRSKLACEIGGWVDAITALRAAVQPLGIELTATDQGIHEAQALVGIAATAPGDLLEFRQPTFGTARSRELITRLSEELASYRSEQSALEQVFWLDALPPSSDLKVTRAVLRRKSGPLAWLDGQWRRARRVYMSVAKKKQPSGSRQRAEELSRLIAWMDERDRLSTDDECSSCFGDLFWGLKTDVGKLSCLDEWYLRSRTAIAECPGLGTKLNLTTVPADRLMETAAKATTLDEHVRCLAAAEATLKEMFGAEIVGFREVMAHGWDQALGRLKRLVENLGTTLAFFEGKVQPEVSPRAAVALMAARLQLNGVRTDLSLLMRGDSLLQRAAGAEGVGLLDTAAEAWRSRLTLLAAVVDGVVGTTKEALAFADPASPFSSATAFASAKAELDSAWRLVAPPALWNRTSTWAGYSDLASDCAEAAQQILERISPQIRTGGSLRSAFDAYVAEAEANAVLSQLASTGEVRRILADSYSGAATDLQMLADTHRWGEAVSCSPLPAGLRRVLLSSNDVEALHQARNIFRDIEVNVSHARSGIERLSEFGSFSWEQWRHAEGRLTLDDVPSAILKRLESAATNLEAVLPWSKYVAARQQISSSGMGDFVKMLETGQIPAEHLASAFKLSTFQSIGRGIYRQYPELSRFNGSAHDKTRSDFRALDAEIIAITGQDFASRIDRQKVVPEGQRGQVVGELTEMHLLRREIAKQRRHIPIRQLMKRAGRALQALKPCFMMGPLSVAQYLEQGALQFDIVVMDEASQLRPEEALGAVARGSQLVVVGDPKQLPPTSFFDRMLDSGDDEDEDSAPAVTSGMESILDICQQLFTPVRSLRWHYRSRHESLIAFSNHHFYKNLIVFPSPYQKAGTLGVKYRFVRGGVYRDRQNLPEAQRVVDAILEHMIKCPAESLGVVTLNLTQRDLIEELLEKKLKAFLEGARFQEHWEAEGWPFFVKNLENVQGDERDVIFISTTFGRAPGTDRVRQNFGPISRPDGWRRLNVLFTRSRRRLELFTSMVPEDIVIDETTPLGTKTLRDYLEYAKRGILVATDEEAREPDSDFEVSVANVIRAAGFEVKPQLGVAGFFIDIAVRNPDRRGEYLAAIECDGATYHSGFSVRDRDRIRQEILESLGWKDRIYRIWSTDWFYNPRRETEKLVSFLNGQRRLSAEARSDEAEWTVYDDAEQETTKAVGALEETADTVAEPSPEQDLFVEVGDYVAYCFIDSPDDRRSVRIIDGPSNPKFCVVNEHTAVAQALLGLSPGESGDLNVPGARPRPLRVLRVQRQRGLQFSGEENDAE
jgi:transcription elongation GreA/GreB family factor